MIKTVFAFTLYFLFSSISVNSYSLTLNAEVDRTQLASNESLRLIVTADETASAKVDFTELLLQFDIINTQRSNQTSIVNGKVSASTQWILILSPKESGRLVIPSFEYRGVYSPAIFVNVNDTGTSNNAVADKDVFLKLSVNKNIVYVQEQLLITIRLYYKTALSSYDDEALQLDNSTLTLVSESNFRSDVKGVNYQVLEKIYALHPQASGTITIPTQSWRLEKALNRFNFGRSGNPYLYVRSDPLTVEVKPIANESTADTWLPSTALTLDGKWKQSLLEAKVGEPLNYQLVLIANGLTAAQLPDITLPESDEFTIYSDKADIDDNKSSIGIIGTRVNNFAIIPRQSGTFTFPSTTIKWWNTEKNREEESTVKAQTIVVIDENIAESDQLPTLNSSKNKSESTQTEASSSLWKILTLLFLSLSMILAYILLRKKKVQEKGNNTSPVNNDQKKLKTEKQLKQDIINSANNKNWSELRDSILKYGEFVSHEKKIKSLSAMTSLYPNLEQELAQLDQEIYSGKEKISSYSPEKLIELTLSIKKETGSIKKSKKLKKLYPN
ncbi:MAG: BatD family protein [Cellvibrionaceae bacterium]